MARFRLLPRDEQFFEFFEQATVVCVNGVDVLRKMLGDLQHAEDYRRQVADLEHDGDSLIHKTMDKLNRTFVTPLDPEDIRALSSRLDDIIDYTQAATERLVLYQVTEPYQASVQLVDILLQTTIEVQKVVALLRDLRQRRQILEHCIEINRLENQGDKVYREAMGMLFQRGDLMELIRWKEIFEQIEQALDECEDLADVIESIIVKNA